MPDVKWIKITTDMFDDEKIRIIESMPEADSLIVIWVKLICQAGKTNDGGYIYLNKDIPYTEETLATVLGRPLNTVRLAIKTFCNLKMVEMQNDYLYLPNFEKHQNIEGMERIKDQWRQASKRYYLKQKAQLALTEHSNTQEDKSHMSTYDYHTQDKNKNREDIREEKNRNGTYHLTLNNKNYFIPINKLNNGNTVINEEGKLLIFGSYPEKCLLILNGQIEVAKGMRDLIRAEFERLGIVWA